jgi:hypothetical protein
VHTPTPPYTLNQSTGERTDKVEARDRVGIRISIHKIINFKKLEWEKVKGVEPPILQQVNS